MTKRDCRSLITVLALAIAGGTWACAPEPGPSDEGGEGGSDSSGEGGKTGGGKGGSTGKGGAGGTTTTGSGGTTGGLGGSGAGGSTKPDMGTPDTVTPDVATTKMDMGQSNPADMGGTPGEFKITIDGLMPGPKAGEMCFKPEASSSGGNKSPKMDWTTPPPGTKSLVLTMFDMNNTTPHQIVCNIKPDVMGRPADTKASIPEGAQSSTGHSKPMNIWYGPGAGEIHRYEIRIWALSTDTLEGGCGTSGGAATKAVYNKLKTAPNTLVLASAWQFLHGQASGKCP